jgi:lipopolysaccharide transport system ATP-binding protein
MFSEHTRAAFMSPSETEAQEEELQKADTDSKAMAACSGDIVISVQNLSKCYQIYDTPRDRLKQFVAPRLQRLLGRAPKRYFREFWALRDISFEVKKGETLGIIGRNGSGKSTLLQIICGTLAPSGGMVETKGRIAALLELGSGFNPEFTGRENIYMNGAVLGLSKEEINERFDTIASFADIGQFIDQPVKKYSSGMSVRLAFAVQAQVDPEILIVDEALSVGDIRFQNKCFRRFDELRETGCSVLFVTHSLNQIDAFCDSAIWLEAGTVHGRGKPASLTRAYTNLMIHGLAPSGEIAQQNVRADQIESQRQGINADRSERDWLPLSNCKNIQNPGRVNAHRFRIAFNGELNLAEIKNQQQVLTVELEVEFTALVTSPLLAIGIFNNLNEPVIHFNSFVIGSNLDKISPGQVVRLKYLFTLPPLRPGEYLVSIGLDDGVPNASIVLCHIYDLFFFRIRSGDVLHLQGGYVAVPDATIECVQIRKSE